MSYGTTPPRRGGLPKRSEKLRIQNGARHVTTLKTNMGVEPKIGGFPPQNGWFISWKPPIKMDDLGGFPIFLETPTLTFPIGGLSIK